MGKQNTVGTPLSTIQNGEQIQGNFFFPPGLRGLQDLSSPHSFLHPRVESAGVLTAGSPGNPQENFRVMKLFQMLILDCHDG